MNPDQNENEEVKEDNASSEQKTPDISELQKSIEALEAKNRELLSEKKAAKKAAEEAAMKSAKSSGDIKAIEESYLEKLKNTETEYQSKVQQYEQMIGQMTAGQQALKLANDLAIPGSSDVLLPHINSRLKTEIVEGKPVVKVLDKDGRPSALTLDDLKKEIEGNKAFAPVLLGSKASGGGSVNSGGEGAPAKMKRSDFDALSPSEKVKFSKAGGKLTD